ncbi:MAG: hypothetical protein IKM23_03315 [Bacteroidales bacterium]|nr:hypothetical protein [Bacteroidales bacterium]
MNILEGLITINDVDIWTKYGVFLTEKKQGGKDNLKAIIRASKVKSHVGVNIREEDGRKYPQKLSVKNEERDVTLHFALFAETQLEWWHKYRDFIQFLKNGDNGWLSVRFPELRILLRMFFVDATEPEPLTYLWREGKQASRFKIKFREPNPIL